MLFRLKRQTAVEWPQPDSNLRLRKSKSLPDSGTMNLTQNKFMNVTNEDEGKSEKKLRKKKKGKLTKKAKVISNVKIFLHKH